MNTILRHGKLVPYLLTLHNRDVLKGNHYLFEISTQTTPEGYKLSKAFKEMAYTMPKNVGWFHQGGHEEETNWRMFEFWNRDYPLIYKATKAVADELGLTIDYRKITREDIQDLQLR